MRGCRLPAVDQQHGPQQRRLTGVRGAADGDVGDPPGRGSCPEREADLQDDGCGVAEEGVGDVGVGEPLVQLQVALERRERRVGIGEQVQLEAAGGQLDVRPVVLRQDGQARLSIGGQGIEVQRRQPAVRLRGVAELEPGTGRSAPGRAVRSGQLEHLLAVPRRREMLQGVQVVALLRVPPRRGVLQLAFDPGVVATQLRADAGPEHEPAGRWGEPVHHLGEQVVGDLVTGRTDGSIGVGADINRARMAANVSNAIDLIDTEAVDGSLPAAVDQASFEDVVDTLFEDEVQALAGVGIVQGVDAGMFSPGASITRGQLAIFVMRSVAFLDAFARFGPTAETVTFELNLAGLNEVNGEGDTSEFDVGEASATATATLAVDACAVPIAWQVDFSEVDGPFAAAPGRHIHVGRWTRTGRSCCSSRRGMSCRPTDEDGAVITDKRIEDVDPALLRQLITDPGNYSLNLLSNEFPPGAVRAQPDS